MGFLYFLCSLSLMNFPEGYAKPILSCSSTASLNFLQFEVSQAFGTDLLPSDHQMRTHIQAHQQPPTANKNLVDSLPRDPYHSLGA